MEYGFLLLVFLISALYASVGHGGASGYLALMAVFQFAPEVMKSSALLLNLFVAGISFIQFYRGGFFKPKIFFLFILASVPAAFLGGMVTLDPIMYKRILGVLLFFAVLRMLGFMSSIKFDIRVNLYLAVMIGAVIGFFSGMIGIGGGIILSPIILLLGWGNVKEAAAVSSGFIWINSVAGLIGMHSVGHLMLIENFTPLIIVAIIGGMIGGYIGSFRINLSYLKVTLSLVLIMASFKLIFF